VTEPVALESIQGAFRGVIPSAFATCGVDGTPNVTYMSIVHYVDSDRVGLSRQFFNKTRANLDENPRGQVRVVDPETWREYLLDLEYVHTETHGPVFEAMSANVEAAAAQSGMSGVFRLRGVDVHRVLRCEHVDGTGRVRAPTAARNVLAQLDELTRRLALCTEYGDATRVALEALDDLFAFAHSILLVRDADRLLAVASNGYPSSAAGAEAAIGEGAVGVAARTRQIVSVPNVARSRVMDAAVGAGPAARAGHGAEPRGGAAPRRERGRRRPLPGERRPRQLRRAQRAAAARRRSTPGGRLPGARSGGAGGGRAGSAGARRRRRDVDGRVLPGR
jgi:hypothetical protein